MFKETLAKFGEIIHIASETQLASPSAFISLHKEFLNQNPQYANKFYLGCLELFIKNNNLPIKDIKGIFPELKFEDPFSVNGDLVHYSTITNALMASNLIRNNPSFQKKLTLLDTPMPRFNGDNVIGYIESKFPSQIKNALEQTNQKTPDFSIQFHDHKRLYDLKMTKSTSYTKVQRVSPLEYNEFNTKFEKNYTNEIMGHIKGLKKSPENQDNEDLHDRLVMVELKIKAVMEDVNLSNITKNQIIHQIMLNTERYPSELKISILYPTTMKPCSSTVAEKIIEKIPVPQGHNVDENGLIKGLKAAIGAYDSATIKRAARIPGVTKKLQQYLDSNSNEL
jgi:hypothetical protein